MENIQFKLLKVRLSGSELLFTHLNAVKAFAGSDVFFSLDEWFACVFIADDGVAKLVGPPPTRPPDCNNPDTVKLVNWIGAGRLLDCSSWDWRESTSEINSVMDSGFNFEAPKQTTFLAYLTFLGHFRCFVKKYEWKIFQMGFSKSYVLVFHPIFVMHDGCTIFTNLTELGLEQRPV